MEKAIRSKRLGDSVNRKTVELVRSYDDAVDSGSVSQAVIDFGLEIAADKVTNGLRNAGLGLDDGTVSAESIRRALSGKIGAEIAELSVEGVAAALNASISYQIGEILDVEGLDLLAGGSLADQARAMALQAIASGRPSKLVSLSLMRELRSSAAYLAAGLSPGERAAAVERARARRWRAEHKQTWV